MCILHDDDVFLCVYFYKGWAGKYKKRHFMAEKIRTARSSGNSSGESFGRKKDKKGK